NVAANAPGAVTNIATVAGGGESNLANDTGSDSTTIWTPSQAWRQQWFNSPDNSGAGADTAVASGDGVPNLCKYALNLNPFVPAIPPIAYDISTGHLRMTVTRNPNAFDITLSGEVNGSLINPNGWSTNGTTIDQNTSSLLQVHDNAGLTA